MHKGNSSKTKFGRPRSQRRALLKSLADSLILDESIETTLAKAQNVARYTEKLITKAKKGQADLAQRRQVISALNTLEAANKLVDTIAPKLNGRPSGYFRVEKLHLRRGDNALMARVSFVDELKTAKPSSKAYKSPAKSQPSDDKARTAAKQPLPTAKDSESKIQPKMTTQAPKRSGVRGNR